MWSGFGAWYSHGSNFPGPVDRRACKEDAGGEEGRERGGEEGGEGGGVLGSYAAFPIGKCIYQVNAY